MSREMLFGERRLYERKSCTFAVDIDDYNKNYSGHLRNLSLGGAFVEPPAHFKPKIGQELLLTIPFRKKLGYVVVKGRITRTKRNGMAVVFIKQYQREKQVTWID